MTSRQRPGAVREILPFVDFLKISEEEAGMLGGEAQIPSVMEQYEISVVVETLGRRGSLLLERQAAGIVRPSGSVCGCNRCG